MQKETLKSPKATIPQKGGKGNSMKRYLTSQERSQCALLLLTSAVSNEMIQYEKNFSKEETTCLKYIRTYTEKWYSALINRVGLDENKRIGRIFDTCEPKLEPKKMAPKERDLPLSDEDIGEMLDLFIESFCMQCDLTDEEEFKLCPMFKLNSDLNVVMRAKPIDGKCPY